MAAQDQDHVEFERQFTQDSAAILAGLRALAEHGRGAFLLPRSDESFYILGERMVPQGATLMTGDPPERVDMAVVDLRMGDRTVPIPLIRERGRWKISLTALEQFWYRGPEALFTPVEFTR